MNDNEIIKAVEYCSSNDDCDLNCPIEKETTEDEGCIRTIGRLALDIIKRYKSELEKKDTEIDILIRKNETLKDEVSELRADKEALINGQITLQNKLPGVLKNEAYKEFADRFSALFEQYETYDTLHTYEILDRIEITLTELIERKEDKR